MTEEIKDDSKNFIAFAGGMIMVDTGATFLALAFGNFDILRLVLAEAGVITLLFGLLVFYVIFK